MISDAIRNIATDLRFQFRLKGYLWIRLWTVLFYYFLYEFSRAFGSSQAQARNNALFVLHKRAILCRFRLPQGLEMEMDNMSATFLTKEHLLDKTYDQWAMPNREDVVVDVGAHQGLFALCAAHAVGPDGLVYAIEPEVNNFWMLQHNIDRNHLDNIWSFNLALQHVNNQEKLYLSRTGSGNHSLVPSSDVKGYMEVECKTLDDLWGWRDPPKKIDLIKIDVEGSYLKVLEGARKSLERYHPRIIMEVEDGEKGADNIRAFLKPFRYQTQFNGRILYAS